MFVEILRQYLRQGQVSLQILGSGYPPHVEKRCDITYFFEYLRNEVAAQNLLSFSSGTL